MDKGTPLVSAQRRTYKMAAICLRGIGRERGGLTFLQLQRIKRFLSTKTGAVDMTSRSIANDVLRFFPRRALMYIPGSDVRKLNKIPSLGVDVVAIDLEDGVAMNQKVLICLQML